MAKKVPHSLMIGLVGSSISKIMQQDEIAFDEAFTTFLTQSKSSAKWDYNAVKTDIKKNAMLKIKPSDNKVDKKVVKKVAPIVNKTQIIGASSKVLPKNVQFLPAIGFDGKGKVIETEQGPMYEKSGIRKFNVECPSNSVPQLNPENLNQGFCKASKPPKPEE